MDVLALLEQQTRGREAIRERVEAIVLRAWQGLGSWDRDDADRFVDMVVPVIEAAQLQTQTITEVYLSGLLSELLGEDIPALGADLAGLRPVPLDEVYRRPFVEHWSALKQGAQFDAALAVGADRLLRLAQDDLALAHRRAAFTVVNSDDRVTGYRRVVRPEMARGGTCGLCIAAASQVYHRSHLLPIHTRCHCDVMPIVRTSGGTKDPARRVNDEDIDAAYARVSTTAGSTAADDLKRVRVTTVEHGELGPILRQAGDEFTGPSDLAA